MGALAAALTSSHARPLHLPGMKEVQRKKNILCLHDVFTALQKLTSTRETSLRFFYEKIKILQFGVLTIFQGKYKEKHFCCNFVLENFKHFQRSFPRALMQSTYHGLK
jgi:hypothetical protein